MKARQPYAYRGDPSVPPFPDERPIMVYDAVCVLCEGATRFALERDPELRFLAAQSETGQALLAHFGLDPVAFDSWLYLEDGKGYAKTRAVARLMRRLGWFWALTGRGLDLLPRPIADWLYDRVARNRYRIFGRYDNCKLPHKSLRARFIAIGPPSVGPQADQDGDRATGQAALSGGRRRALPHGATSGTDRSA